MNTNHWKKISEIFTAEDLMTPRDQLQVLDVHGESDSFQSDDLPFDIVPVVQNDQIVGVLEKGTTTMQPLSDRWLISRDTEIPDMVSLFAHTNQKAFLILHKQDVIGLVSPADLNKLPARVYIYNLIGGLELVLMELIVSYFCDGEDAFIRLLSESRQEELGVISRNLRAGNADVNLIQYLYLSDLINIVTQVPQLWEKLGFRSRAKAKNSLGGLNDLRCQTMHLVRPLIRKVPEDVDKLHQRVLHGVKILENWMIESNRVE